VSDGMFQGTITSPPGRAPRCRRDFLGVDLAPDRAKTGPCPVLGETERAAPTQARTEPTVGFTRIVAHSSFSTGSHGHSRVANIGLLCIEMSGKVSSL
jgi:hypothetical protein